MSLLRAILHPRIKSDYIYMMTTNRALTFYSHQARSFEAIKRNVGSQRKRK